MDLNNWAPNCFFQTNKPMLVKYTILDIIYVYTYPYNMHVALPEPRLKNGSGRISY